MCQPKKPSLNVLEFILVYTKKKKTCICLIYKKDQLHLAEFFLIKIFCGCNYKQPVTKFMSLRLEDFSLR